MKKRRSDIEIIERTIRRTYNRGNRKLREQYDTPYDPSSQMPLGYSWAYVDPTDKTEIVTIFAADLGPDKEYTQYRIKAHEWGHCYFGHLSSNQYQELDRRAYDVLKNYRGQLIDEINKECKITWAEELINRILDDPKLNHELHNIAMDMEVNTKILSPEDIEEMEKDISDLMPKYLEEDLKAYIDSEKDEEKKKEAKEALDKLEKESKIKFILPGKYHDKDGNPWPDGLSYPEYFLKIIRNLSQFIKMMVSISMGGSGDTSEIDNETLQKALGNGSSYSTLEDLMKAAGMFNDDSEDEQQGTTDPNQNSNQPGQGERKGAPSGSEHDTSNSGGFLGTNQKRDLRNKGKRGNKANWNLDHRSPSRDKADHAREVGSIAAGGGYGCGSDGDPDAIRTVRKLDPVDEAIDEVMNRTKTKVLRHIVTRNVIRNYNLGKNRSVIAPSMIVRNRIDRKPKLVFIIDISGSMDTDLIDRIISTIARKMASINRGLKYDIITWSTSMGEWIKNIDPRKSIPKIHMGGGTRLSGSIRFIKENYDSSTTFIICSDFEDYLEEWVTALKEMPGYEGWGFNYGRQNYKIDWPRNFKVKNFNKSYVGGRGY